MWADMKQSNTHCCCLDVATKLVLRLPRHHRAVRPPSEDRLLSRKFGHTHVSEFGRRLVFTLNISLSPSSERLLASVLHGERPVRRLEVIVFSFGLESEDIAWYSRSSVSRWNLPIRI